MTEKKSDNLKDKVQKKISEIEDRRKNKEFLKSNYEELIGKLSIFYENEKKRIENINYEIFKLEAKKNEIQKNLLKIFAEIEKPIKY